MDHNSYLTTPQLAERIGLSPITLEIWRSRGSGPPYIRIGRAIRYDLREVERWLASRAVDPDKPAEQPAPRRRRAKGAR